MIFSCRIVSSLKRLMQWCSRALTELSPLVMYAGEGVALVNEKTFTRSGVASDVEMLEMLAA